MQDNLIQITRRQFAQTVFNTYLHYKCRDIEQEKLNKFKKANLVISVIYPFPIQLLQEHRFCCRILML